MNAEVVQINTEAKAPANEPVKPTNPAAVKKAVALGKDIRKQPEETKADAARDQNNVMASMSIDVDRRENESLSSSCRILIRTVGSILRRLQPAIRGEGG